MDIEEQYDKIFHYCYYRIRDKNVAEDITQEVFLRFYNSNYVEQQKEIRYLYTIARNLCIDEYRKRNIYKSQIEQLERWNWANRESRIGWRRICRNDN